MEPTAVGRGQRTREALRRAAVALVAERGWGSVSTRLVAERAGVPAGAVHYHFASLTDLLVDATAPLLARITDEAVAALDAAPDLPAGVDWLLGAVARYSADPAALRLPGEVFLAGTRHERLGREIAAMLARFRASLAGWLGRCGCGAEADAVATLLAAALDGLLLHRAVDPAVEPRALTGVLHRLIDTGATDPAAVRARAVAAGAERPA